MNKIIQILIGAMKKMKPSTKYIIGSVMALNGILFLDKVSLLVYDTGYFLLDCLPGITLYAFGTALQTAAIKEDILREVEKKGGLLDKLV